MKKIACLIPLLSIIALVGCSTDGGILSQQVTSTPVYQTNVVSETNTVVLTNTVTQTLTTGVTVTNQVYQTNVSTLTVPVVVTNQVNQTNYVVSGAASNVLATISAANTITGAVDPFSGWITLGLTAITGILGYVATVKTKAAATHASVAQTVITAVEGLAPTIAPAVKAAVAAQSAKMGTSAAVNAVVSAVTQNLPSNA